MKKALSFALLLGVSVVSLFFFGSAASTQTTPPECQAGRGGTLYARGGDVVVEILQGNPDASFTSEIRLLSPGTPRTIGTNRQLGTVVNLGRYAEGTELVFGIVVNDTIQLGTFTYSTGPAARNPDNVAHAEINCLGNGISNVSFEDGYSGGDSSFNDVVFQVRAANARVESLEFEDIDSPLDTNPNAGGGRRIYPDKQTPGDTVNRRRVRLRGDTSFAANRTIYFRSFDLDDPSTNASPVDPNSSTGDDNRGVPQQGVLSQVNAAGSSNTVSAATDSAGIARADLTVTLQPGDNFMIAASHDQAYLNSLVVNGITLADATGSVLPTDRAKATPMLTVWRKLYIEDDSMGSVSGNNRAGTVQSMRVRSRQTQTELTINQTIDSGRFENGLMTIAGSGWRVVSNTSTVVTVQGILPNSTVGSLFNLVDDDDFNNDDNTFVDGDNAENVSFADKSLIQDNDSAAQNVFAPAYVRPTYGVVGDNNDFVPFVLNSPTSRAGLVAIYDFDAIGTHTDNEFWTVYLLGSYQGATVEDRDPNSEAWTAGIVDAIPITDGVSGQGASVFNEILRSGEVTLSAVVNNAATTAHEMGHLFNGLHSDLGLMAQSGTRTTTAFSNITLDKIRSINHP